MIAANLGELELLEGFDANDPTMRARFGFPITGVTGSQSCTSVYIEIDPGNWAGMHQDITDEVAYVLAGEGEGIIGDATAPVKAGDIVLLPRMVPHGLRNTGRETLRILTFLPGATLAQVWDREVQPIGTKIIGTPDFLVAAGMLPAPEPAGV